MKAATLMACMIVTVAMTAEDVRASRTVSTAKLDRWTKSKDLGGPAAAAVRPGEIGKSAAVPDELTDLLEVVQYIIIDALNNSEYRSFMIKRFLHNYVRQASKYLDKIKSLKKKMNPEEAKADEKKDKAMKNHK